VIRPSLPGRIGPRGPHLVFQPLGGPLALQAEATLNVVVRKSTTLMPDMPRPKLETPKALPVSVRLPPAVKAAAEKAAKEDTRSLSSLIEKVLTEHLKAKGHLRVGAA
jgi:hypothetical protein